MTVAIATGNILTALVQGLKGGLEATRPPSFGFRALRSITGLTTGQNLLAAQAGLRRSTSPATPTATWGFHLPQSLLFSGDLFASSALGPTCHRGFRTPARTLLTASLKPFLTWLSSGASLITLPATPAEHLRRPKRLARHR